MWGLNAASDTYGCSWCGADTVDWLCYSTLSPDTLMGGCHAVSLLSMLCFCLDGQTCMTQQIMGSRGSVRLQSSSLTSLPHLAQYVPVKALTSCIPTKALHFATAALLFAALLLAESVLGNSHSI